jgi:benzoyl-CoA reductase/2-hydroxyglutaryl-CoA dehydratase subunit BcrC/BadD/HgdB
MITSPAGQSLKTIVRTCRMLERLNQSDPSALKSDTIYFRMLQNYFTRLLNARENGDFIVSHTVFCPSEILLAMDIVPMHTEVSVWMMSLFTDSTAEILSSGAELGLAPEICSAHRGISGAFMRKSIPQPDAVLWTNLFCDASAKSGELFMHHNHCPGFYLDHPFQETENEVRYLTEEMKDLIQFLEKVSGRKMNWDKLSQIVARVERQIEIYREILELRKAIPSPYPPLGYVKLFTSDQTFSGDPMQIEYLEAVLAEIKANIAQGKGTVSGERFRLMNLFVVPMYMTGYIEKTFREFGAASVTEPFLCNWGEGQLDPSRPLESLVKRSYMYPSMRLYGTLGVRATQNVIQSARDYNIHGAINFAHVGCRQTAAVIKLFKDILGEIDIPALTIDCDIVDPTVTSQSEVREKLERFFELLEERS